MLARDWPMLVHAAAETGGVATQNRGTIGGNIANASPAADTPPALLVYDAELELLSSAGVRRIAYRTFHTGYKKMDLGPGEIISRILLPRRTGGLAGFLSQGRDPPRAGDLEGVHGGIDRDRRGRSLSRRRSRWEASRPSCSVALPPKPR